uniref:Uncharacterized protein n=1 Tax=Hyaloperonospora arabidopsidis (strain Emoy2) TaxID=559515 RepID=M4C0H3_HYAAE
MTSLELAINVMLAVFAIATSLSPTLVHQAKSTRNSGQLGSSKPGQGKAK